MTTKRSIAVWIGMLVWILAIGPWGGVRSGLSAELRHYAIEPAGEYTFLASPLSDGIPGGVPSAYRLEFLVEGTFAIEYSDTTARFLMVDFRLLGNEPVQDNPALRDAEFLKWLLEPRPFKKQPPSETYDLYSAEDFTTVRFADFRDGSVRLEADYDQTQVDGFGYSFRLNAVVVPEPHSLVLAVGSILAFTVKVRRNRSRGAVPLPHYSATARFSANRETDGPVRKDANMAG